MHSVVMSHSKKTKVVTPITGAMLNPPVPAGVIQPNLAEAAAAVKAWADTRTFTKQKWGTALVSFDDNIRRPNAVDQAGAVALTRRVLNEIAKEFSRHGLSSANGLPDPSFYIPDNACSVFNLNSPVSTVPNSSCDSTTVINDRLKAQFGNDWFGSSGRDNLAIHCITEKTTGVFDGTKLTGMFAFKGAYTDEADAIDRCPSINHEWNEYITIAGEVWWSTRYTQWYRADGTGKVWWDKNPEYPWTNFGPLVDTVADAIAMGPIPNGGRVSIKQRGAFQNNTGAPAVFDYNTWSVSKSFNGHFIACATGGAAYSATWFSRLREGDQFSNSTFAHEISHTLDVFHMGSEPGVKPQNCMSGSGYRDGTLTEPGWQINFAQACQAYLSKRHLGVSNIATDYDNPIWTITDLAIGPSDDGSGEPTLAGKVQSSNQANVPIFCVICSVNRVDPVTKAVLNPYDFSNTVAALVKPDGTFSVKLHYWEKGAFVLNVARVHNLANVSKAIDLTPLGQNKYWSN